MDWTDAVASVIGSLVAAAGSAASAITHLAVDAQVDGVVAVDSDLRPLHEAIIWMDRRAVEQTRMMEAAVGVERLFEITGLNCDSSHSAPKMAWLLDRFEPRWLLPPATMVTSWLTGEVAQDPANASSSMLWDVTKRTWSDDLLHAARIEPSLLATGGRVDRRARRRQARSCIDELGLPAGCQVLVGTGDDHAAAVGAGAVGPGSRGRCHRDRRTDRRSGRPAGFRHHRPTGGNSRSCRSGYVVHRKPRVRLRREHPVVR